MASNVVPLRHSQASDGSEVEEPAQPPRRPRPRSASYVALRSAVYQLTSMADFKREKIGAGFFADVYKVHHKTTGEVMVLKMNKSRKTSRSMLSEIQLMNRLSHPNILKFKGSCVHEGHLHALTEYINGGSLEELLMDQTVSLPWAVRMKIIRDIVNGMGYLHSKGVFHRDLNPKNCLIQREKDGKLRCVVADFGLAAKIKQRRRRSHTEAVGSPYWMAPELLKGKSYCEQADVFSFGITLAEIMARISADPDFMPRTQKFGLDVSAMRPMCEGCPEELFEVLDKCCQIDPDDRPNFEEIGHMLDLVPVPMDPADRRETLDMPPLPSVSSPATSHRELRECISEPHIRLDDGDLPEDDSRSCGSEGESRVIVEHHSRRQLLGSLGSSTSSSCGSIPIRGAAAEGDGVHHLETGTPSDGSDVPSDPSSTGTENHTASTIGSSFDTSDCMIDTCERTDASDPIDNSDTSDTRNTDEGMVRPPGYEGTQGSSVSPAVNSRCLLRRSSTLREESTLLNAGDAHKCLQKSKSLNVDVEDDKLLGSPHVALASRQFLNSSAQTLVPEDGCDVGGRGDSGIDPGVDIVGGRGEGGGDSGIDPGDVEVFQFPASSTSNPTHYEYTATSAELSCDQGDHTPICTSPSFNSAKCCSGSSKAAVISVPHDQINRSPRDLWIGSHDQGAMELNGSCDHDYFTSPVHSRFSFSGASSDELAELDGQNFVTPTSRSISPFAQSWTSSECSFSLPTPTTPWAPPSSPLPPLVPHSLPTSPSHCNNYTPSGTSSKRPFRKSHEVPRTTTITSCLRKTPSSGRPRSCRNSTLFPDSDRGGFEARKSQSMEEELKHRLSIKSVHFMDCDDDRDAGIRLYSDDEMDLERFLPDASSLGSRRPRSKSNPQTASLKASCVPTEEGEGWRSKNSGDYGIKFQHDYWVDSTSDPHSCKGYKIAQRSNTRLSSSTPDLSKLTVSFLVGPT